MKDTWAIDSVEDTKDGPCAREIQTFSTKADADYCMDIMKRNDTLHHYAKRVYQVREILAAEVK